MKNGIMTIAKKELFRFFGDRRMVLTTLILPGLLIYIMYTFMGSAINNMYTVDEDYTMQVSAVNLPASMRTLFESASMEIADITDEQAGLCRESLAEKQLDLLILFPADFSEAMAGYEISSGSQAPNIEIYYNSSSTNSAAAYSTAVQILDGYEAALANKFDINRGNSTFDLASEKDTAGSIFSSMLPLLLLIFLFSGCMAVATESIAGEKERGTIATMFITPVKRRDIAIGKIAALAVIALLSGASSALGTILSLPKLMGAAADSISVSVYTATDYLLLGLIILSTVLVLVTLISLVSAFSKTIKEAQTLVMPLMIVVMAVGITAMFGGGAKSELPYDLIPLYNSVQCMVGIFSFEAVSQHIAVTLASNLFFTALGVFALAKIFNSEKIIFSK